MAEDRRPLLTPPGRLPRALATLDPGYFAWVMGSGIVSVGTDLLGYRVLSRVVLGVTIAAFVLLSLAYGARAVLYRPFFRQSLKDPTTAMAYFTVVAGTDVLAARLSMAGHPWATLALGAAGALAWLVLSYGLPFSIMVAARRAVLREINGTWLIWVVATQSVSIVASAAAATSQPGPLREQLPVVAVTFWAVGVMLYIVLIVAIFLRLLLVEVTAGEMGPAYWIAMGATAISTRAAAGILVLHGPGSEGLVRDMHPFVLGFSFLLWAFGTWWIPLLVLFGLWRYVVRGYSKAYEPRLWSVVFPLGMYTVASLSLGRAAHLGFLVAIARLWVWVGVAAWAGVSLLMVAALVRALTEPGAVGRPAPGALDGPASG